MSLLLPGPRLWDIFCRVIDNHGDLGVCWRLARGLAGAGERVRLWVDEPAALAWMAPAGAAGVRLMPWPPAGAGPGTEPDPAPASSNANGWPAPGDVVVEAFGCDPPPAFVAAMAATVPPPVWINLEYLSAEPYAARSHGLRSPQSAGPGRGLDKWFFYPGFGDQTGGLLHGDRASLSPRALPERAEWAAALGLTRPLRLPAGQPDDLFANLRHNMPVALPAAERLMLLFGYPQGPWTGLFAALAGQGHWRLLVPPGGLQDSLAEQALEPPVGLAWQALAALSQPEFDSLLAGCDLVLVRGEDSFVRAQLAGDAPFLWQIYAQPDGAHVAKLDAFLALYLASAAPALARPLAQLFRAVNGLADWPQAWPDWALWQAHQRSWRLAQLARPDLVSALLGFVEQHRAAVKAG